MQRKDLRQYIFKKKRGLLPTAYKESYRQFIKMLQTMPAAGHNGGNPAAALWFMGREIFPGGGAMAHNKKLRACASGYTTLPVRDIVGYNATLRDVVAELGLGRTDGAQTIDELYSKDVNYYCANMYPFALDRRPKYETLERVYKLTGLPTIEEYEQACIINRAREQSWCEYGAAARVIVFIGRPHVAGSMSDQRLNCLLLMSKDWVQFGDLVAQYQATDARDDEIIKITSGDRTFVFADLPGRTSKKYPSCMAALTSAIRAAAAEQGVKLPPAQQS